MDLSNQTLTEEIKAVGFEKDDLEYRFLCRFLTFSPFLANQDSESDAKNTFFNF